MHTIRLSVRSILLGFFALSLAACQSEMKEEPGRLVYSGEELELVAIDNSGDYSLPQSGMRSSGPDPRAAAKPSVPGGASIVLVAQVDPPEAADGGALQASHVTLTVNAKYAVVSYMRRGEGAYGALDLFDVSKPDRPVLVSSLDLPGLDVAAVAMANNLNNDAVYLAGQKAVIEEGIGNGAYVRRLAVSKGVVQNSPHVERWLPGYFATDIIEKAGVLYVTTGTSSDGGTSSNFWALDSETLEDAAGVVSVGGYPDLRSVAVSASEIAVLDADNGSGPRVDIFGLGLGSPTASVSLATYAADAEAKAKLEYNNNGSLLYAAVNHSGVVVIDTATGSVINHIPAPNFDASIIPLEDQSSNAVSFGTAGAKELFFIANGEAGLWVGDGDVFKADPSAQALTAIAGSIRFGAGQSVNYAAGKNSLVVAAAGSGGLKMMNIVVR